jgi:hypothetical protein
VARAISCSTIRRRSGRIDEIHLGGKAEGGRRSNPRPPSALFFV